MPDSLDLNRNPICLKWRRTITIGGMLVFREVPKHNHLQTSTAITWLRMQLVPQDTHTLLKHRTGSPQKAKKSRDYLNIQDLQISFILRSRIILKTKCVPSFGCAKPCPRCRNRMSPSQMFLPLTRQLSVLYRWCNVPAGISTNQLPFVLCSHNNLFKSDLCH